MFPVCVTKANGSHCPWRRSWSRLGCLWPVQSHRSSPPSRGWPAHSWLPGLCERTRRKRSEWQWLWCMPSETDVSSRFRFTVVAEDSGGAAVVTHPENTWLIPGVPQLQSFESTGHPWSYKQKQCQKVPSVSPKEASSSCLPVRECEEQSLLDKEMALGIKLCNIWQALVAGGWGRRIFKDEASLGYIERSCF